MTPPKPSTAPARIGWAGVAALGMALGLAIACSPAVRADGAPAPSRLADKAPSLPVSYTFEKVTDESGPYVLHLKNTSSAALTVNAQVTSSVTFHANSKTRTVTGHIDPGQVWTVTELAASDKVVVSADGFEPLELTVP